MYTLKIFRIAKHMIHAEMKFTTEFQAACLDLESTLKKIKQTSLKVE